MNRLSAMEAFVRVIETGSFSGAARALRIGQPAVSKAIAQIEERLGVRLLVRTTHGLTPTESGDNFYEHAKRAIEEAEEADLAARGAGATLSGRLRIGAAVTFARLHVMRPAGQRQGARVCRFYGRARVPDGADRKQTEPLAPATLAGA